MIKDKIKFEVTGGDILQELPNFDFIVNSSNARLHNDGGLSQEIVAKCAGVQEQCDMFIKAYQEVPCGGYAVTTAGPKSNSYIIHVNGPKWSDNKAFAHELLECTVLNILDAAKDLADDNYQTRGKEEASLVLTSISVGSNRFPADEAGQIMIETIFNWCHLSDTGRLSHIRLMNFDEDQAQTF